MLGGVLDPLEFEQLLHDVGETPAYWKRRIGLCPRCSSRRLSMVSYQGDCPLCGGTGELFREMTIPTTGTTGGKVALQSVSLGQQAGGLTPGLDSSATLTYSPSDYPLAKGDLLGFSSRVATFTQLIDRGPGLTDRLRPGNLTALLEVYTAKGRVTTGYSLGGDARSIVWVDGHANTPDEGDSYTVLMQFVPGYRVEAIPRRRPNDDAGLPFVSTVQLTLEQFGPLEGE